MGVPFWPTTSRWEDDNWPSRTSSPSSATIRAASPSPVLAVLTAWAKASMEFGSVAASGSAKASMALAREVSNQERSEVFARKPKDPSGAPS